MDDCSVLIAFLIFGCFFPPQIEHLIQAADVSHMMQRKLLLPDAKNGSVLWQVFSWPASVLKPFSDWNIYIKWNEVFFRECYQGYLEGRADKDPSEGWFEGEKGFYDFYVIPLAKKLDRCGVFGVSSAEYLNYALTNRKRWEVEGKEIVQGYLANFRATTEACPPGTESSVGLGGDTEC